MTSASMCPETLLHYVCESLTLGLLSQFVCAFQYNPPLGIPGCFFKRKPSIKHVNLTLVLSFYISKHVECKEEQRKQEYVKNTRSDSQTTRIS